jgi:hypothetical protein
MKNGLCPRCRTAHVHARPNGLERLEWQLGTSSWQQRHSQPAEVITFLCVLCGYFENYLLDRDQLSLAARKWPRVG